MSLYFELVPTLTNVLTNAETWVGQAHEYASTRGFDAEVLLAQRLAPDMLDLKRQFQILCDHAKFAVARSAGKQAPSHPDTEKDWAEIRARLATVKAYVASYTEADFQGAEDRIVTLPFLDGARMKAPDYARQMAMPNVWFHAVTAYGILRHSGVPLGKRTFVGRISLLDS